MLIKFSIPLLHEFLESYKVVDCNDLIDNTLVNRILIGLLACLHELLLGDAELREQMPDELLHDVFEIVVDLGILQFVFVLGVENNAVLIQEAHDRSLPPWRSQEVNNDVKEPVIFSLLLRCLPSFLRRCTCVLFRIHIYFYNKNDP